MMMYHSTPAGPGEEIAVALAELRAALPRFAGPDIGVVIHFGAGSARVWLPRERLARILERVLAGMRGWLLHGGRVELTVRRQQLDATSATLHGLRRPDAYVTLAFADNGTGLSPGTVATTVADGPLAEAAHLLEAERGALTVSSESGYGSVVRVYLPRADHPPVGAAILPRGRESILLLEADLAVRRLAAEALRGQGYMVRTAMDAADAVVIAGGPRRMHLLATDLVQPATDVYRLVRQVRAAQPELRVLFMSARTALARERGRVPHSAALLERPFSVAALAEAVRAALDA